jgi:hypothetical protein
MKDKLANEDHFVKNSANKTMLKSYQNPKILFGTTSVYIAEICFKEMVKFGYDVRICSNDKDVLSTFEKETQNNPKNNGIDPFLQ